MACVLKYGYRSSGNAGESEEGEDGMNEWKECKLGNVAELINHNKILLKKGVKGVVILHLFRTI